MKHLQKIFSTHRLIRSQPESEGAALTSDFSPSESPLLPGDTDSQTDQNWQRRRLKLFPTLESSDTPCGFIGLWDENGMPYSKKI